MIHGHVVRSDMTSSHLGGNFNALVGNHKNLCNRSNKQSKSKHETKYENLAVTNFLTCSSLNQIL